MLVRPARAQELTAAGDLRVSTYVGQGLMAADSPYIPTLRALGADGTGTVLVAVDDGDDRLLGTALVLPYRADSSVALWPDECELRALAVAPRAQGRGVGRRLLRDVVGQASTFGARAVVLSTQPNMLTAQRMYLSSGFVRLPQRDWSPRSGVGLLAYRLELSERPGDLGGVHGLGPGPHRDVP